MMLEQAIGELKNRIWANNGRNIADLGFATEVDRLISVFYDDIGELKLISMRSLFDLFLIKALYVERGGRDAAVVDYLGEMLTRYLFTQELFPMVRGGHRSMMYLSDLLEETRKPGSAHFQNLFEAYRKFADNSLFIVGIFPESLRRGRRAGRGLATFVDRGYFSNNGKTYYKLASQHDLAEFTRQRETLEKLSAYFDVYSEALNEVSERYVMGLDMNLIADKMLDSFNLYRRTGEQRYMGKARKYAALLQIDQSGLPAL
ncbi:MAG: hypothetical protein ACR2PL_01150, partial [Dehalococcoidia bacterium]